MAPFALSLGERVRLIGFSFCSHEAKESDFLTQLEDCEEHVASTAGVPSVAWQHSR